MTKRDKILYLYPDNEFIFFDDLDDAIIGVVESFDSVPRVLYDEELCVGIFMRDHGMDEEEAYEYFDYNVRGAYVGEATPAFATLLT